MEQVVFQFDTEMESVTTKFGSPDFSFAMFSTGGELEQQQQQFAAEAKKGLAGLAGLASPVAMKRSWSFGLAAAAFNSAVGSPNTPSAWQLDFEVETETEFAAALDSDSDTSEEDFDSFGFSDGDATQFQFDDASFLQEHEDIEEDALADLKALPRASPLTDAKLVSTKIKLDVSVDFQQKAARMKKRKRSAGTAASSPSLHDWNLTPLPFKEAGMSSCATSGSLWNWEDTITTTTTASKATAAAAPELEPKNSKRRKKKEAPALKAALTAVETIQQLGKDAADKPPATLQPNSMYKGVSRGKREGTWQAKLTLTTKEGKKLRWNGTFEDQTSAAHAYDKYVRDAVTAGHRPGDMRALQRWKKMKKDAVKREARGLSFDSTLSVDYEYHPEVNFPRPSSGERQATRQKRWGRTVTAPREWGRIDPSKLSGKKQGWKVTRADGTLVGHFETELKALDELKKDFEQRKALPLKKEF